MSVLVNGSDTQATGAEQIDSIVPGAVIVASKTLVAGVDREIFVDPSAGDIVLTMPTIVDGVRFFIKRVANGANLITFAGPTIDSIAGAYTLGLMNQYVELVGNIATGTYEIVREKNQSTGSLNRGTPSTSFGLTTSFVKYTDWEIAGFDTPGKLESSIPNNDIAYLNFRGNGVPARSGIAIALQMNIEYTNNNIVTARLVHSVDGQIGFAVSINALGSGKPVILQSNLPGALLSNGDISLELMAENAGGTFNVINAALVIVTLTQ